MKLLNDTSHIRFIALIPREAARDCGPPDYSRLLELLLARVGVGGRQYRRPSSLRFRQEKGHVAAMRVEEDQDVVPAVFVVMIARNP
jgi:hypothetical protein